MSEEKRGVPDRDVRTLLFCKDVPSPHEYKSLFEKISEWKKGRRENKH